MTVEIRTQVHLEPSVVTKVKQLINVATTHDDLAPLSEHVLIHLHHGGDEADEHTLAWLNDELVGYLHLDQTDRVAGPVVELVVHPDFRRKGIGSALISEARSRAKESRLRLWAHGELDSAYQLAASLGFAKSRELWQMRRSLLAPIPKFVGVNDVVIRPFVPGQDEDAWIAVNAQVFEDHPEQGQLTRADLDIRMSEAWFDPLGFLLAEQRGEIIGFHWTKIHGGQTSSHGHPEMGEVYALGVRPAARKSGLGRLLTIRGLEYLRDKELSAAMLYVDADNVAARKMYETLGFSHWDTDVMFTSNH
ncbi:MAG: mycothiol synthase [Actinobacteria bacterium]|uniref:Unannotated protein n=1 Tax=freshwater metagenome TaxID=449393 RepID=A0A6J5YYM1_9ZZZZ|nr:mycothiol synthase [Actinomycetota bacterium]